MGNIFTAIIAIAENSSKQVKALQNGTQNRANQMGDALEDYVRIAFTNCLGKDRNTIISALNKTFSYLGNNSNPPDAMLRGGDAIEIKKIKTLNTSKLQFNSSFPKNKLYSTNPKICTACKDCENWTQKDMLYVIGQVDGADLKNIFFIYGDIYCDSPSVYERTENIIKDSLESLEDVTIADTNELGRINNVDHLGITDLRIRGMWLIQSPFILFDYLLNNKTKHTFRLIALIPSDKYYSLEHKDIFENYCTQNNIGISDVDIQDPRNPANLIPSKLIIYEY